MIKTEIKLPLGYTSEDIKNAICNRLPVERCEIGEIKILKRELKLLEKSDIHYGVTVGVEFSEEREAGLLKMRKKVSELLDYSLVPPKAHLPVLWLSDPDRRDFLPRCFLQRQGQIPYCMSAVYRWRKGSSRWRNSKNSVSSMRNVTCSSARVARESIKTVS